MARYDTPIGLKPVLGTLRKQFAIYIITNRPHGVLYTGMTSSLAERIRQHKDGLIAGFTCRYRLTRLVYFDFMESAERAIAYEKRLKRWRRDLEDRAYRTDEPNMARPLAGYRCAVSQ